MTNSFGAVLRAAITSAGLTQAKTARAAGCTQSYVSRLVNDVQPPSAEICRLLADALRLGGAERASFFCAASNAKGFQP